MVYFQDVKVVKQNLKTFILVSFVFHESCQREILRLIPIDLIRLDYVLISVVFPKLKHVLDSCFDLHASNNWIFRKQVFPQIDVDHEIFTISSLQQWVKNEQLMISRLQEICIHIHIRIGQIRA